jgi:hypothetical protein
MITMSAARLLCGLAILAPVVPALPPTEAAEHAQLASVRAPTYEQQQGKINAWIVGDAAGLIEGAPSRPVMEMARVVDDGTNVAPADRQARHSGEALSARRRPGDSQLRRLLATCAGRTNRMP